MRGREIRARRRSFRVKTLGFWLGNALMFVTAAAATPPPVVNESISESETSWRATAKPSEGLTMGRLKTQFEKTTLPEIGIVCSAAIDPFLAVTGVSNRAAQ